MTSSARDNILTSLLFQRIAKEYLELTKHEVDGTGKHFLNQLTNRLNANLNDCYSKLTSEAGRKLYFSEMNQKDTLQYADIFLKLLECDEEKRNTIEKLVASVHKGEVVEFVK
jgi:hypothetical protein